jgi:hypothetical protein
MKGNDNGGWIFDGVVLCLGKMQNGDAIECWGEWSRLKWFFYSCGGWEPGVPERIACGGGADSMIQFQLKRGRNRTKRCRKMKRSQRARLGFVGRKRDMARRCDDIGRRRDGTGEGKGRRQRQLCWCESYWAEKRKKFMRSIQLVQIVGEDLKQRCVILFFKNICKWVLVLFISSRRTQRWKRNFKWISYKWDKSF